jgi:hypothetical protein
MFRDQSVPTHQCTLSSQNRSILANLIAICVLFTGSIISFILCNPSAQETKMLPVSGPRHERHSSIAPVRFRAVPGHVAILDPVEIIQHHNAESRCVSSRQGRVILTGGNIPRFCNLPGRVRFWSLISTVSKTEPAIFELH